MRRFQAENPAAGHTIDDADFDSFAHFRQLQTLDIWFDYSAEQFDANLTIKIASALSCLPALTRLRFRSCGIDEAEADLDSQPLVGSS